MSEGGGIPIVPIVGVLTGFCLIVFIIIPLLDEYFTNGRWSWVSGIADRIGLVVHKTKFLPGLEVEERRQVLEHMFQKRNLTTDKEAGKLDESTTPTVLDVADEQDRVEPTKIPSNNALYNLEDGSKTISAGGADYGCDDDVCAICLEPHVDDAEEGTSFATSGTQCSHLYHKHCIIQWMEKRDICPFCRKDMFTENEFESSARSVLGAKRVEKLLSSISSDKETESVQ